MDTYLLTLILPMYQFNDTFPVLHALLPTQVKHLHLVGCFLLSLSSHLISRAAVFFPNLPVLVALFYCTYII